MKLHLKIIVFNLLYFLLVSSICNGQKLQNTSLSIAPFGLLKRNIKLMAEMRFNKLKHSILVSPNYFFGYRDELVLGFNGLEDTHYISGAGLEISHRVYHKKMMDAHTVDKIRYFLLYGGGVQTRTVKYDDYVFYPFEENGLQLYTYGEKHNIDRILHYYYFLETGIQMRAKRFLFEASWGGGYQWAEINLQYKRTHEYGENKLMIGYQGVVPRLNVSIGLLLF